MSWYHDPPKLPDHYPRTSHDWRDIYNSRRPVFDRSKTGQRLNTTPLNQDAIEALDEHIERELA